MPKCSVEIKRLFPELSDDEITEMVDIIQSGRQFDGKLAKFQHESNAINKAKQLRKNTNLKANSSARFKELGIDKSKPFGKLDPFKGYGANTPFMEMLFGSDTLISKGRMAFSNASKAVSSRLSQTGYGAIVRKGLTKVARSGELDREVSRLADAKVAGEALEGFSKQAKSYLDILDNNYAEMRRLGTEHGIEIVDQVGYIGRRMYDPTKVQSISKENFHKIFKENLDTNQPFLNRQNVHDTELGGIIEDIRKDILKGQYEGYKPGGFGGSRVLNWKNNEAWMNVNDIIGRGTLMDSIIASSSSFSKSAASTKIFGPLRDKGIKAIEDGIAENLDDAGKAIFNNNLDIFGPKTTRDAAISELMGYQSNPSNVSPSAFTKTISLVAGAANLGSSFVTTIADIPNTYTQFKAVTGNKDLKVAFDMLKSFNKQFVNDPLHQQYLKKLSLEMRHGIGGFMERIGVGEAPGVGQAASPFIRKLDAFNEEVIKYSGLPRQTSVGRATSARMFSSELAEKSHLPFTELHPKLQATLKAHGMNEAEWGLMKHMVTELDDGYKIVSPELMFQMEDNFVRETGLKLSGVLHDVAHTGIQESTAFERAMVLRGTNPNTIVGAALRLGLVFKSFPLARVRTFRRIGLSNPNGDVNSLMEAFDKGYYGDLGSLGSMIMGSAVLEAGATVIKRELQGKGTELNSRFVFDSVQRAAAPLSADYALNVIKGQYNRYGGSVFKALAGPVLGQVPDIVDAAGGIVRGAVSLMNGEIDPKSHLGVVISNIILNNMPGKNVPILPAILQKLVTQTAYDFWDPEYSARMRNRQAKQKKGFFLKTLKEIGR